MRFTILAVLASIALGSALGLAGLGFTLSQRRPAYVPDAPLTVKFLPESASAAEALVCLPDPSAPPHHPGLTCMDLADFLKLSRTETERRSPTDSL